MNRLIFIIWFIFFTSSCVTLVINWPPKIELSFLELLPQDHSKRAHLKAIKTMDERFSKKIIFLVHSKNLKTSQNVIDHLKTEVNQSKNFTLGQDSFFDSSSSKIIYDNFFNSRYLLSPNTPTDQEVFLDELKKKIYSGFSPLLFFEKDPFLCFESIIDHWSTDSSQLEYNDGYLQLNDHQKTYLYLSIDCSASPFSKNYSKLALDEINSIKAQLNQDYQDIEIKHTGVLFFAKAQADKIEADIKTISSISLIFISALILLTFKKIKPLLITILAVLFGLLNALIFTLALVGECHLVSIGFGATLIGISVDYAFHALFGLSDINEKNKPLFKSMLLGLLTSMISFSLFLFTPFFIFQQISIFIITGLCSAFLFVYLFFPKKRYLENSHFVEWLAIKAALLNRRLFSYKKIILFSLSCICIVSFIYLLLGKGFSDDIRALGNPEKEVLENDQWIKKLKGEFDTNQLILIEGESFEDLLHKEEQFMSFFGTQREPDSYLCISKYLSSQNLQKSRLDQWKIFLDQNSEELNVFFKELSFPVETLAHQKKILKHHSVLNLTDYFKFDLFKALYQSLVLESEGHYFSFIYYFGDEFKLDEMKHSFDFVHPINRVSTYSNLLKSFREFALKYALIIFIGIMAFLMFLFGLKDGYLILLVPSLALGVSLAINQFFSQDGLNLFHLLASLLVWGIGIDYAIMAKKLGSREHMIVIANLYSALTTLCSFGILAMSETPVLNTFGSTILIGITISFVSSYLLFTLPSKIPDSFS